MFDVSLARLEKGFLEHSPCSQRAGTPVEELACVGEVLRVLGIDKVDIPWPLEALDALPNGRMHHNLSHFGSGKGDVPHILDTGQHKTLTLGIDLVWKLTGALKRDEDVTVSFFRNDICHEDSVDALSAKRFIMEVTAGSDYHETPERWLNVSIGPIMNGPDFELAIGVIFATLITLMKRP
ncbi:hypothetical protein LTR29_017606 [Friedmanniomyces endolithicus]|nr:hypothetical protein LTR35_017787 [Friedmanniomyces endolithicus]KAK0268290.1 hypothetical protein LTS00_017595 [Friedmanniomyces endolithicus]KAK0302123.1 hypothetical protein LTR01_008953 [Friedmanniomyces endolithicus]KAK0822783.1 hypothetical protein LTR73_009046 [Friedmanniomyces endolithicus]KAK0927661.1 hypothetical protein LTR29_017606 [Friedmanniomyces endolithicus]